MNLEQLTQNRDFDFAMATKPSHPSGNFIADTRIEVSIILSGSVCFDVDGQTRMAAAPCATLQSYQHSLHVKATSDTIKTMWCYFRSSDLSDYELEAISNLKTTVPLSPILISLFTSAFSLPPVLGTGNEAPAVTHVRNALGKAILAEYIRNATDQQTVFMPAIVKTAKQVIDNEYHKSWSVEKLASLSEVNANYFIHLFKSHVGIPPIQYLWQKRLEAGVNLLLSTTLSIEEIAHLCGFQSAAHFSRKIKENKGVPPSQLRH